MVEIDKHRVYALQVGIDLRAKYELRLVCGSEKCERRFSWCMSFAHHVADDMAHLAVRIPTLLKEIEYRSLMSRAPLHYADDGRKQRDRRRAERLEDLKPIGKLASHLLPAIAVFVAIIR